MDSDTLLKPRLQSIPSFVFLAFLLHLLLLFQKSFTRRKLCLHWFFSNARGVHCLRYPFTVSILSHSLLKEWFLNSLAFALFCENYNPPSTYYL